MELFKASNQWANRPPDERFWTVEAMHRACLEYAETARTATIQHSELRVEAREGDLVLMGKQDIPAKLTNHSFGQLASRAQAPPNYLQDLPATLAAQNLNYGLKAHGRGTSKLLLHENGGFLCRAFTSDIYKRLWNYKVCEWLQEIPGEWRVPPARAPYAAADLHPGQVREATEADIIPGVSSVGVGELIAPAGLYASDHDMFVFMINPERQIEAGQDRTLCRGFFLWNAETGGVSFGGMTFLFDSVCGNHIVWGAENVKEFRLRHVGAIGSRAPRALKVELRKYADESVSDLEAKIARARTFELGKTPEEVIDAIFKVKSVGATKKQLEGAFKVAEENPADCDNPRSAWGMAQGLTRLSQEGSFADGRVRLDRAAGKVIEMAF
jgi:hypothetical protein